MKSLQNATKLDFLYDMHSKTWQHYQGEKKGMYLVKDGRNMEWEVAEQGEKEKEKKLKKENKNIREGERKQREYKRRRGIEILPDCMQAHEKKQREDSGIL